MAPGVPNPFTERQDLPSIAEFYRGKSIFITGGTGFLGKLLVETLARCCPDIKQIFLLCRTKKGKTIKERIFEQLNDPLYDYVKETNPEILGKIVPMTGENQKPNLGLSNEDIDTLLNEVNIIFHVAATVRFDEELSQAVPINVRSTRDIILFARRMTRLAAVVHVSTAYSNCLRKNIDEQLYKPPIDGDTLIDIVQAMDDEMLQRITPGILAQYPNTYTFTKCVAEDIVRKYSAGLPIAIVRPSIVTSTYEGTCPGWIDKINGPVGIGLGLILGVFHSLYARDESVASMIPADYVINAIVASAWAVGTSPRRAPPLALNGFTSDEGREVEKGKLQGASADDVKGVTIYNSVTSDNPTTWGDSCRLGLKHGLSSPSKHMMWKPFFTLIANRRLFTLYSWLVHWIPAYVADTILKLAGRKPSIVKIYAKADKFQSALAFFMVNEWHFGSENTKRLFKKLSDADKAMLPFDVHQLDWSEFFLISYMGTRKYILKETLTPAHRKQFYLNVAHYVLCTFMLFVLFTLSKLLLSCITY